MSKQIMDAQAALGFVLSQTSHIETQVNETVYPEIQYPQLIPVDTSANPFVKTVTYFSTDKVGKADWINQNADDIPLVDIDHSKHETQVHTAAVGYDYGFFEINQAQQLGVPLDAMKAMAARRAYEEMVDRVAVTTGAPEKGFSSLISYPGVVAAAATTGDWATATEDQIIQDVNDAILGIYSDTEYTSMADTLLMPHEKFAYLANNRLGDNNTTVLNFIRANNIYTTETGQPLTIRSVRGLKTAGVGSTARMVAYRRNPEVLKMHIPMPHRFLPAFQAGPLRIEIPGVFALGGLDIRRKKEVRYVDGI